MNDNAAIVRGKTTLVDEKLSETKQKSSGDHSSSQSKEVVASQLKLPVSKEAELGQLDPNMNTENEWDSISNSSEEEVLPQRNRRFSV